MRIKKHKCYVATRKELLAKRKAARETARASAQKYNLHLARQRARCAWQKCKFAIQEPKPEIKEQYITELRSQLMAKVTSRVKLCEVFKNKHRPIAKKISHSVLKIAVCRIASKKVVIKVLRQRKKSVAELLRAINRIKKTQHHM